MDSRPSLNHQIDRALLEFNHILLCAPNEFPQEEGTNLQKEFARLLDRLKDILNRVNHPQARQWIQLSIGETEEALGAYLAGDEKKGSDFIQTAEEHFRNYLRRKKARPTFIAGPEGDIEKA